MSDVRAWAALCSVLAVTAGCNASIDGSGDPDGPGNHGNAGSSGVAGGPSTSTLGRDAVAERCEASQLAPPQLRRLTAKELERTLRDVFPSLGSDWAVRLGADPVSPLGFSNDARTLVVGPQTAQELLGTAEDVAESVIAGGGLATLAPCAAEAAPGRACADQLVQTLGARLFRRPVADTEASEYGALFDSVSSKSDFLTGARWLMVALMQSPSAVYRAELGVASGSLRKLDGYELATELAYTFGGTAPSPELTAAGARGDLAEPAARVAEAKKLLETPAGREQLRQFLAEWSGYGRVASKTKTTVEDFEGLRGSMLGETGLFLGEAVVSRRGGVREILTASYTFLDGALSQLYGFGGVTGTSFQLVERPAGQGLGLLSQGSMLAGSAHSDASSPTLRGLLVYERLLCHQKPPPLAMIPAIEPPAPGAKTTRERYEISHGASPSCAACHRYFDPIGFGFEHYDEAGRYRADEQGLPINASGMVRNYPDGEVAFEFDGLDDLAAQLADHDEVSDCVSGLAAAYAFAGAGGRTCLAETARAAFARGELGVLDYFAELAASPSFAERAP
jgi:hypothetical protein